MNNYYINTERKTAPKILTENQLKSIEKRQELAIVLSAQEKIEDYKDKVFGIIDKKGLDNEDDDKSLKTALQVLEYIIPKKKSTETTIITRKLEDIIADHIQEAEIIEEDKQDNKTDDGTNV